MDPMYREIKKIKLPCETDSTLISTANPKEMTSKLRRHVLDSENNFSLLLLIGSVGSGKTTFVRYFKEVIIKKMNNDMADRCEWIFINMNSAPINTEEVYSWIKKFLLETIQLNHADKELSSWERLKQIFNEEIYEFENGRGKIIIQVQAS